MKKKVVIAFPESARRGDLAKSYERELASVAELFEVKSGSEAEFVASARDADAIITSWGVKISREIIGQLEKCVAIGVVSVGTDMVDVDAATNAGIVVINTPDIFIEEVADHTMMLILAMSRRLRETQRMAGTGEWLAAKLLLNELPRLWGQTLGLVSFGNVACAVARRARPFGLHIIAHDPYVSELKLTAEGVEPVSRQELLERSDYLSMHAPHNQETHHYLSGQEFRLMKKTAVLVNTGRGATVDEAALIAALDGGEIAGAGLDVLEFEIPDLQNPLFNMPSVIITPHIASATSRMRPVAMARVGREVAQVLKGRWPMSCVNPSVLARLPLERWQPIPMDSGPRR